MVPGKDKLARDIITEGGYGEYFTHRTGHGLGMEAHEGPYIFQGNPLILEPGMVFTIELHLLARNTACALKMICVAEGLRSLTDLLCKVMRIEEFSLQHGRDDSDGFSMHLAVLGPIDNNVYSCG